MCRTNSFIPLWLNYCWQLAVKIINLRPISKIYNFNFFQIFGLMLFNLIVASQGYLRNMDTLRSYIVRSMNNNLSIVASALEEFFINKVLSRETSKAWKVLLTWCHPTPGWVRSKTHGTRRQTCRRPAGSLGTAAPACGSTAAPGETPPHCSCWRWSPKMNCRAARRQINVVINVYFLLKLVIMKSMLLVQCNDCKQMAALLLN